MSVLVKLPALALPYGSPRRPVELGCNGAARPGVQDGREAGGAGRDGDAGRIGNPELVRPVHQPVLGQAGGIGLS